MSFLPEIKSLSTDISSFIVSDDGDITGLRTVDNTQLREYVITVRNKDYLDALYADMEFPEGNSFVPHRSVEVAHRRPMSTSTHYWLTAQEAAYLKGDTRIKSIELAMSERPDVEIRTLETVTSDYFSKSNTNVGIHKNWALLRSIKGKQTDSWGNALGWDRGVAVDSPGLFTEISNTITLNDLGDHVDIVIMDGSVYPNHPEFADSTGTGSRFVQYNWFVHDSEVLGVDSNNLPNGVTPGRVYDYSYDAYTPTDAISGILTNGNHGTHVASSAAGLTQGWARRANIYNIDVFGGRDMPNDYIYDYLRAWHNSKPINPATGRANPTVVNQSWGSFATHAWKWIYPIHYRDSTYYVDSVESLDADAWQYDQRRHYQFGMMPHSSILNVIPAFYTCIQSTSRTQDMLACMDDGIIMVGAAGNNYCYIADSTDRDYNNWYTYGGNNYYYHRGMSPNDTPGVILVSALSSEAKEHAAQYTNGGTATTIFSPGNSIQGAYFTDEISTGGTSYYPGDSSFQLKKMAGTSMASPQVAGILACALSHYPDMTQSEAKRYIQQTAWAGQIYDFHRYGDDSINNVGLHPELVGTKTPDSGSWWLDNLETRRNGPNLVVGYKSFRATEGAITPKRNLRLRPTSGRAYPRIKIKRKG